MHDIREGAAGRGASPRIRAAIAGLLLLLALPGGVAAHADLVSSTPADGETLTTIPVEIVLTFDEAVTGGSSFSVLDTAGATVATGGPDAADPTLMRTTLPALEPGVYEVQWTSVAEDGDVERGMFRFTIAEPTAPPATPTPAPTDAPTAAPTPPEPTPPAVLIATPAPTAASGTGTAGGTDVLLPILAVVVLVGVGLAVMLRRRGAG